MAWSTALTSWWPRAWRPAPSIPDGLWAAQVARLPFLDHIPSIALDHLRTLSAHFLAEKEFHGAHGLVISDAMALTVSIQACLPLVGLKPTNTCPLSSLDWYNDFVTIVMHRDAVMAHREQTDSTGVVHHYGEAVAGEAMAGGPVMLSWSDVQLAPSAMQQGHNLVIHEFAHKLDMRHLAAGSEPQGHPRLPVGFLGLPTHQAQVHWAHTMQNAYRDFCEAVSAHQRFGEPAHWLDAYAASAPAEFFAVTCEAYFVQRQRFSGSFPRLLSLYDGFFDPHGWLNQRRPSNTLSTD